ncbi:cyclodeaminase/cyclohydrolase family protein [Amycolatopsis sp. NPDC004368]
MTAALPIGDFLTALAARSPTPGGGATAALHAAQAAALLGMVGRYTTGPRYADHATSVEAVLASADAARSAALTLADDDATAFAAVAVAYRLPQTTGAERAHRTTSITTATAAAAEPPAAVLALALELMDLAEDLLPIANRNVLTDVAAASEAARAAATTARLNVEINLRLITEPALRTRLLKAVATVEPLCRRAARIDDQVRQEIAS